MNPETLSIEQFLAQEDRQETDVLAVIEKDPANPENVRITPWRGEGCNCSSSLSVSRKLIASVEQTGNTHYCCGGSHTVMKVNFIEDAAIPVAEVFKQLAMVSPVEDFSSAAHATAGDVPAFNTADMEYESTAANETSSRPSLYPLCIATSLRKHWCGPIIDRDGNVVRRARWVWVPSRYVNRITGQPCNIHINPCG